MTNEELFNRYLSKDLDLESQTKLKNFLSTPEGRKEFFDFMSETSQINHYLKLDTKATAEDRILSDLVRKSEEKLMKGLGTGSVVQNKEPESLLENRLKPKHLLYLSVLTLASMIIFASIQSALTGKPEVQPSLINPVARVIKLNGQANVNLGDWLKPGEIILKSGNLELAFDSGSRVLLQDSAIFQVETENRAFLQEGKITAYVPPEAKGFVVNTSESAIVDLGTEFAVNVDRYQKTDVVVFDGQVEVSLAKGNEVKVLSENETIRVAEGQFRDSLLPVNSFERLAEQDSPLKTSFIYWPFDSVEQDEIKDMGNGGFGDFYNLKFSSTDISMQSGKFGDALQLNGNNQYLTSKFKGISGKNPRTISFWLKIPHDLKEGEHYAIIAWGRVAPTHKWQLGVNLSRKNGMPGAIRTEFSKGYVVGTTDLRDGRWHHVTSVFIGGDNADVATHVRHYIDGRLEGVSGFKPIKINTSTSALDSQPAYVGKYINKDDWYLRGGIDEMYIFESALTPAQIVKLRDRQLDAE